MPGKRLSIVVLPFANLSGDQAQDYVPDSLTDELTTALARIRDSFVIARNTAMTFKGKPVDAKAIGKDLGVRYVLEGSVLPAGDKIRVNAQLIDADSGAHLWADQSDTARADLLQTQDEIVTRLAHAMDVQLSEAGAAHLKRTPAANLDAEDLALRCEADVQKSGNTGKDADAGSGPCEQALAADPNNVRALTWLAVKTYYSFVERGSACPRRSPHCLPTSRRAVHAILRCLTGITTACARRGCRRSEAQLEGRLRERVRCSSLVDWPGLSALEEHYAGLNVSAQFWPTQGDSGA
jgi:TolB-like protein